MNDKALTVQENFEERILDKLREDIGELMPDEMLVELVNKAVDKVFFQKRTEKLDYQRTRKMPSWFEEEVEALIKLRLEKVINAYITDNHEAIIKLTEEAIAERLPGIMVNFFAGFLDSRIQAAQYNMEDRIRQALPGLAP